MKELTLQNEGWNHDPAFSQFINSSDSGNVLLLYVITVMHAFDSSNIHCHLLIHQLYNRDTMVMVTAVSTLATGKSCSDNQDVVVYFHMVSTKSIYIQSCWFASHTPHWSVPVVYSLPLHLNNIHHWKTSHNWQTYFTFPFLFHCYNRLPGVDHKYGHTRAPGHLGTNYCGHGVVCG